MKSVLPGLILLLGTAAARAQTLGQGPADDISMWRVVGAFALCVALAVAGALILKARSGTVPKLSFLTPRSRRLQLVETLRLDQRASLSIVVCDGSELLVSSSEEGVKLLRELPKDRP